MRRGVFVVHPAEAGIRPVCALWYQQAGPAFSPKVTSTSARPANNVIRYQPLSAHLAASCIHCATTRCPCNPCFVFVTRARSAGNCIFCLKDPKKQRHAPLAYRRTGDPSSEAEGETGVTTTRGVLFSLHMETTGRYIECGCCIRGGWLVFDPAVASGRHRQGQPAN